MSLWEKEQSEQTLHTREPKSLGDRFSRYARLAGLFVLATAAVWLFPRQGLFCSLSPGADSLTVPGIVKAAPRGLPLPQATVYSDRDLAVTDDGGSFRIAARRGSFLTVEAPGFEPAQCMVRNDAPLILLLFPEKVPPSEGAAQ